MDLTLHELFKWRYMQTDPNPANFFFDRKNDRLLLLDFGATHSYSKQFMDTYIRIVHAATQHNRKVVLDESVKLGFLTGEENP